MQTHLQKKPSDQKLLIKWIAFNLFKPLILILIFLFSTSHNSQAQISYNTAGSSYTQNFDNLYGSVPANNTTQVATLLPAGWIFTETGSNANTTMRNDNGSSGTGDTYLDGTTASNERAFGGYASGSLTTQFGAFFVNNTGSTLTQFTLTYTGEQWKDGGSSAAVLNTDVFAYSINPASITSGTYTNVPQLDFTALINNTSSDVTTDGNLPANQAVKSFTVTGINWTAGSKLYIRWTDDNDPGNDDNLAIDGVSFTASAGAVPSITLSSPSQISNTNIAQGVQDQPISNFQSAVTVANATLNSISFITGNGGGNYSASDITNFKLFYNSSSNTFSGATQIGITQPGVASGSTVTFSSLSKIINSGTTGYFWITASVSSSAIAGNKFNANASPTLSFTSGTISGSISAGGNQTIISATPLISLANGMVVTGNIPQSAINNVLYRIDATVSVTTAILNSATVQTAGTYLSSDISNLKLWYSTSSVFSAATSTLLSTIAAPAAGSQLFSSLSQPFPSGIEYLFITTDVPCAAAPSRSINVNAVSAASLSFASGTPTGTSFTSGGVQTFTETTPLNATSPAASGNGNGGEVSVSWTNPSTGCFNEVMIVAATSSVAAIPTGDGNVYNASLVYGAGSPAGNGFVVYKGINSPEIISGLTNGTTYFFKIFTRNGSTWSAGTEVSAIPFATPVITELILPQYMQGNTGTNSTRVPFVCLLTLNNLIQNASYRYYTSVVTLPADLSTSNGAGNCIFPDAAGFTRSSGASLATAGNYGTFNADVNGTYTGWFAIEPSGNARFAAGNDVNIRIMLNDGAGGTSVSTRPTTTNSVAVINFTGVAPYLGTGLRGNSFATAKNFIVAYDNISGSGRPLSASFVESDGTANTTANSYAGFYSTNVEGVSGAYGMIIPNINSNGIRRLEQRTLSTGAITGCTATDADGVWSSGADTRNPAGGTTALVITNTDAPFVNQTASVSIAITSGTNPACSGNTVTFTATQVNGGATPSYQWTKDGSNVGNNSPVYIDAGVGGGNIICVLTSSAACVSPATTASNSISLVVNSFISPVISGAATVCEHQQGVIYSTSAGENNYVWSVNGGTITSGGGSSDNTVTVAWGAAGTGHVFVNYIDANGCTSAMPFDFAVTINNSVTPAINITANPGNTICAGTMVTINSSITNGGNNPAYNFLLNNSSVQNGSGNSFSSAGFNNNDTIIVTLTSNFGCATSSIVSSDTIIIHVSSNVNPVITGAHSFCAGSSTVLDAGAGYSSYLWSPGGQTTQTITVNSGGTFSVSTTNGSCNGTSAAFSVTVNPLPALNVSPASVTICNGQSQTLTASGDPASYAWAPSAGLNISSGASVIASPSNNKIYTVTATDANGCTTTSSASVSVNAAPAVTVSPVSATISDGQAVTITASGAATYSWTPGGATTSSITVIPSTTTSYTVTGTTTCSATAVSTITVTGGDIVVLQVGGNAGETLINTGNSLHIKQFTTSGAVVSSVDLPVSGCTPLLSGGTATSEGGIALSADKSFIIVPGYVTNQGGSTSLSSSTSVAVNRGIGRVDASGHYTLPARSATAFTGNNIRSSVSDGNNNFWAAGAATGVCYFGTGTPATVSTTVTNIRFLQISNNNLYFSTGSGTVRGIYQVGTGLPKVAGSVSVNVINTGSASSPYGFQFNAAGNICYIADDNASAAGGIQKWVLTGSTWSLAYSLTTGVANTGARGLIVDFSGSNPKIYSTSAEATSNRLFVITDMGTKASSDPTLLTLATATSGGIFRGIAFAPVNSCASQITINSTVTNNCGTNNGGVNISVSGGTSSYSYAWSNATGTVCTSSQNLSGVGAGTYIVAVTDSLGRCYASSTSTVQQFAPPTPAISGTISFCAGGSTTLSAGISDANGNYISYLWNPGMQTTQSISVTSAGSYSVMVTNVNGCSSASAPVSVTQNAALSPVISGNLSFCSGGSTTLDAGAGYSSYLWSNNATTQTISVNVAGTFSVMVTDGNGCTGTSDLVTVSETSGLAPVISGSLSFCTGSYTTLSVPSGYLSYSWSPNGETSNSINVSTQGTYSVTVSDGSCTGTSSPVTVSENPVPSVAISPASPAAVCKNTAVNLSASGTAASYSWSPSQGLNVTTGANVIATPASTTSYTVTATNSNSCTSSSTVTITINQLPVIAVSPSPAVVCEGNSATLTASGASTYVWNPSTFLNSTSGSVVTSQSPSSNISYIVTGSDVNNCSASATAQVIVTPALLAPAVSSTISYCQNAVAVPLSATANPSTATLLWYTSSSGGTASTIAPTPSTSTVGSANYYVSQSGGGGIQIAINGYADNRTVDLFSFVTLSDIPAGSKIYFTDNGWNGTTFRGYPGTGLAGSEGVCKFRAVNNISAGTVIVSYSSSPDYVWVSSGLIATSTGVANSFSQLSLSQTGDQISAFMSSDSTNPIGSITKQLFIFDDTKTFEPATNSNEGSVPTGLSVADGNAVTLLGYIDTASQHIAVTGSYIYLNNDGQYRSASQWFNYVRDTTNYTRLNNDLTTSFPVAIYNVAPLCESARSLIEVDVTEGPHADASSNSPVCTGGNLELYSDPFYLYTGYAWTGPAMFSSTDQNPVVSSVTSTNAGNYSVTVTDINGCSATETINVFVSDISIAGIITNSNCAGGASGAIDITTTGGVSPYTYSWSTGETTEDISSLTAGIYSVTATDSIGCTGSASFTVSSQNNNPTVTVTATPSSLCPGQSSVLRASGAVTYTWSPSAGLNTTGGDSVIATPSATTTYSVTSSDMNGCPSTVSVTVTVNPNPVVSITPASSSVCEGSSVTLSVQGATSYAWSPSQGLNAATGSSVIASPVNTTSYTVTGTSAAGCSSTATATVSIMNTPSPNVTSPVAYCLNGNANPVNAIATQGYSLRYYTTASSGTFSTVAPTPSTSAAGTTTYYVSQISNQLAIAITGWVDNGSPDAFAFVALSNIPAGTVIYFTDNGWTGTGFRGVTSTDGDGNEGVCKWTSTNSIPAGSVIYSNVTSANYVWATSGTIPGVTTTYTALALSGTGDQIYAFTSTAATNPMFNTAQMTHLYVFDDTNGFEDAMNAATGSVPPGLTAGVNANSLSLTSFSIIGLINDGQTRTVANWYAYASDASHYQTTSLITSNISVDFGCESPRIPVTVNVNALPVVTATADSIACNGGATSLNISGSGTVAPYSGSGTFTVNAGTYNYTVTDGNSCSNSTSVSIGQPVAVTINNINPASACPGTEIIISGSNLSGATNVSFNGVNVFPVIISATEIHAVVPAGASTGVISINTTAGCGATGPSFTVTTCSTAISMSMKVFLQGYYTGDGRMQPVLMNEGVTNDTSITDTVYIELYDSGDPTLLIDRIAGLLMTDGTVHVTFANAVAGVPYWLSVTHRNTLRTWASATLTMNASTGNQYDFTTSAAQALGNTETDALGDGIYSMYTGDVNQDNSIDPFDFPAYDLDNLNGVFGMYVNTDFNGDGSVDPFDFPLFDVNNLNGVYSINP